MERPPSIQRKALTVALLTVFLDMLGFGILIPILPLVLVDPSNPLYMLAHGVNEHTRYITLGFLIALYPMFQLVATPILGQLSDRWGRKPLLIFSLAGTLLSYVFIFLAVITRFLPLLFIARIIDGISGGNISVAQALISDVSGRQNRAKFFGFFGAAYGLGIIIGPLIGTRLTVGWAFNHFWLMGPYVLTSILALINLLFVIFSLPETHLLRKKAKIKFVQSISHVVIAFSIKKTRLLFLMNFLLYAAFSLVSSFLSLFLVSRFKMGGDKIGIFISVIGVSLALGQIFFTKILVKKVKTEERALVTSLFGAACGVVLIYFTRNPNLLFITAPIFACFLGLSQVYILSLVSKSVSDNDQGEILGVTASVTSLAQAVPPVVAGYSAALFSPGTPILLAAFSLTIAGSIYFRHLTKKNKS